jgi:serine kinase of HPr protein (carbohydrate metabolism regulator)
MVVDLITYLDEKLAEETTVSGVLMSVYGKGVLLLADSGMGKSETALELIRDGQVLIADDRVDLQKIHNSIVGHAPDLLKGMLELRGIGIVDVARMYGANCLMDKHVVDLVINLVKYDPNDEYERLGEVSSRFTRILDILIPTIVLPVRTGRSMRILIESAVTNFILKEEGYIEDYAVSDGPIAVAEVSLKYYHNDPVIRNISRESKPGRRVYVKHHAIPEVLGGLGLCIISTSHGVMSGKDARTQKLGGELICTVY